MHSKQLEEFYTSLGLWGKKGCPEMIPVKSGRGPFSNKIGLLSNLRLYYLYNPDYAEVYEELREHLENK